ncbi:MAG: DUF2064 domain-containing protein, partial [Gammaproteobacteria bacterium]|nr:DUF2064 domain-containing protein [Gammaproteobacteria bacterium]
VLNRAYSKLCEGFDAVLGSSEDGGYYLIGARSHNAALFMDINWASHEVFEQTQKRMSLLGWCWDELNTLWDVDTPEDLEKLRNSRPDLLSGIDSVIA